MSSLQWVSRPVLRDPIGLLGFEGWGDAGESASTAVASFLNTMDHELVAMIDADEHFDFQVRRPIVSANDEGIRSIGWPKNEIHAVRAPERDLLVMLGEEPNYRWRIFGDSVIEAMTAFNVRRAITVGAFIGQVAHTLPVPLIGSATKPETISLHGLLPSNYEGPTGIVGVLNHALGHAGIDVTSVWAAVPHYLSNQEYPPATEALAVKAAELAGISLDIGELTLSTRTFMSTVDEAIEENDELLRYVERLEEEADEELRSGDQLVNEIEDFLKDQQ